MSLALKKVSDYIAQARILLQDRIAPYRYDDDSLVAALNLALLEVRRLRADLFVYTKACKDGTTVPSYVSADSGEYVPIEEQFRQAVLNGMVGFAIEQDQEDIQDKRAAMFIGLMRFMLTGQKPAAAQPQQVVAQGGDS